MSFSNAHKRAISPDDVPKPGLSDLRFEASLRRSDKNFTISVDRKSGRRTLGVLFPVEMSADAWEADLQALSREQGLTDGHTVEARQRREEPVSDAAVTSRVLSRRG